MYNTKAVDKSKNPIFLLKTISKDLKLPATLNPHHAI
jgi:hypothetical protein